MPGFTGTVHPPRRDSVSVPVSGSCEFVCRATSTPKGVPWELTWPLRIRPRPLQNSEVVTASLQATLLLKP